MKQTRPEPIVIDTWELEKEYERRSAYKSFLDSFPEERAVRGDWNFDCAKDSIPHALAAFLLDHIGFKAEDYLYVACSYGFGPHMLDACGHKGQGIDISGVAVGMAKERGVDASCMDAFELRFPDNRFDLTLSRDFIIEDYWWDPMRPGASLDALQMLLAEQFRVLGKGGLLMNYSMRTNTCLWDEAVVQPWSEHRVYELMTPGRFSNHYLIDMLVK